MTIAHAYDKAARELRRSGPTRADRLLDMRELVRLATLAASSHNTQPWQFRTQPKTITILPDFSRRCPVVHPDDGHLFKSLGCAAENLVHAASAQGFVANLRFNPDQLGIEVHLERAPGQRTSELYPVITHRQCVRLEYSGEAVGNEALSQLETAGCGPGVRTLLLTSSAQKEAVAEYVARGDAAQLSDPAFREELVSWIRFNPGEALTHGDGLSGRTSGQPPLLRWLAKRILGRVLTPKAKAETDARHIRSFAGVAVFVAEANDSTAWIEVGRAYERFALKATALDIRTAFINQPIEVRALRPQFESWLNLNGDHALLAVRFGYGPTAPFSLRRPLEQVILPEE